MTFRKGVKHTSVYSLSNKTLFYFVSLWLLVSCKNKMLFGSFSEDRVVVIPKSGVYKTDTTETLLSCLSSPRVLVVLNVCLLVCWNRPAASLKSYVKTALSLSPGSLSQSASYSYRTPLSGLFALNSLSFCHSPWLVSFRILSDCQSNPSHTVLFWSLSPSSVSQKWSYREHPFYKSTSF